MSSSYDIHYIIKTSAGGILHDDRNPVCTDIHIVRCELWSSCMIILNTLRKMQAGI